MKAATTREKVQEHFDFRTVEKGITYDLQYLHQSLFSQFSQHAIVYTSHRLSALVLKMRFEPSLLGADILVLATKGAKCIEAHVARRKYIIIEFLPLSNACEVKPRSRQQL